LPTKDLAHSCAFYEALGFRKVFQGDVAIFAVGVTSFILQRYYDEAWAKNAMMQVLVDDLDDWWEHVMSLDLPKTFHVAPPKHPKCSLGESVWPTSTIQQAYYGISLSADQATPPINALTDEQGLLFGRNRCPKAMMMTSGPRSLAGGIRK
jgi:hypothetical protein